MARYVDGYILPVPKRNLAAYRKIAAAAGRIWMDHGALEYRECVGEDLTGQDCMTSFPRAIKIKPGETVVFSYIVFKSRAHRDRVNDAVMKDPRTGSLGCSAQAMPFELKRAVYGGFDTIVDLGRR